MTALPLLALLYHAHLAAWMAYTSHPWQAAMIIGVAAIQTVLCALMVRPVDRRRESAA